MRRWTAERADVETCKHVWNRVTGDGAKGYGEYHIIEIAQCFKCWVSYSYRLPIVGRLKEPIASTVEGIQ